MISYRALSIEQKTYVVSILQDVVDASGGQKHYQIDKEAGSLNEKANALPTKEIRDKVSYYLGLTKSVFAFEHTEKIVRNHLAREAIGKVKRAKITGVDPKLLPHLGDLKNFLPEEVKPVWDIFSKELKLYVLKCLWKDLNTLFDGIDSQELESSFRSPVLLAHPKIPFRLPNALGGEEKESEANSDYDLIEIIKMKPHPKYPTQRRNPITGNYFDLNDILPADDVLIELESSAKKAKAKIAEKLAEGEDGQPISKRLRS